MPPSPSFDSTSKRPTALGGPRGERSSAVLATFAWDNSAELLACLEPRDRCVDERLVRTRRAFRGALSERNAPSLPSCGSLKARREVIVSKWSSIGVAVVACVGCGPTVKSAGLSGGTFVELSLNTANGLSGLGSDASGALWTVAERADMVYRIVVAGSGHTKSQAFRVEGVPDRIDLEGIAVLPEGRFAFGTEGKVPGIATVLLAHRDGNRIVVDSTIELPERTLGLALPRNEGAEGICNIGDSLIVALEASGTTAGQRWAPIVFIDGGKITRVIRLMLTSDTGKLSALECSPDGKGWAIERNFGVTRILAFELHPDQASIHPTILLDLTVALHGRLNLEGLARLADGRFAAVVDNQWKGIVGPNLLLVFTLPTP